MKQLIPEKIIENYILNYLIGRGFFVWKNQSVGIFDPIKKVYRKTKNKNHINGVSDILGILPDGKFLAIEVKSKVGRLTDSQKEFLKSINKNNGLAFVARDLNDVVLNLKKY